MDKQRPDVLAVRSINDIGLLIEKKCRLPEIKFYVEGGSVLFWATVLALNGEEREALQYLDPITAMKFAKAMEACAVKALKDSA